ncbi:MAG: hypothetical protein COA49_00685 [Bacteroidetes bacterium]|nr:MAG: hypothetical protein COA49_00685 [Bacteroidota bacterium]
MQNVLRQILPHFIAVLLLFCVSAALYSPSILKGEKMRQGDTINFKGMSHEIDSYYSIEGERPGWTDSMFSGMPTIQITGIGFTTVPKVIWLILRFFMSPEIMTLFMAMLAGYVLALCLKAPPWVAFIIGATYGLASVNTLYLAAGHASKVRAIAVMPGVLGGVLAAFRGRRAAGVGVFTLFLAIHLYANHLQMTYYLVFLVGAVMISELIYSIVKGQTKSAIITSSLLLAGAFSAVLPQSAELALTQNYSQYTTRGEVILSDSDSEDIISKSGLDLDYILEYSMARGEWLSMIVPDIKGGADKLYWGEQRFSGGAFYFGAIAFALFIAFFFVVKDRVRWPLLFVTLLAIILSWRDTSFIFDFFIDYVPLFNKFRDTKMMLVLVQVCVSIGATLALKQIWNDASSGKWKPWVYSLIGVVITLGLFYILPKMFFDFTSSIRTDQALVQIGRFRVVDMRLDIFKSDILRSMGLIVFAAGLVFAIIKGVLDKKILFGIFAVLMVFDLVSVNKRYPINWVDKLEAMYPFEPTPPDLAILELESKDLDGFEDLKASNIKIEEEKLGHKLSRRHYRAEAAASFSALNSLSHYRVLDWQRPFNDARTSYFHKSVGGYHGAKLRRYQDFIDHVLIPEREEFVSFAETSGIGLATTRLKALAMLNTKYIILPGADQPLPLSGALGAAWITSSVRFVENADEEISEVRNVDLSNTAIIHREFESEISKINLPNSDLPYESTVKLSHYHPEKLIYSTQSDIDGIMVLSEVWYPEGWTATIDGSEANIIRANYILRALVLPAGDHVVELKFEPVGRKLAGIASGLGSLILLLFLGSMVFLHFKK